VRADIREGKLNGSKGSAFTSEKEKITIASTSKNFHFTGFTSFESNCDINPGRDRDLVL
jgi:hypothetical protein